MAKSKLLDVTIETPRGCRNKFKFDPKLHNFRLGSVLPAGAAFPYDFGFIPDTKADDGDPLDVLVLMDESAFPGCIVSTRIVGALKAEQQEDGEITRNDRIIAVAEEAHDYHHVHSIGDVDAHLLNELERFFIAYNETRGKKFTLLGTCGPKGAWRLIERAEKRVKKR